MFQAYPYKKWFLFCFIFYLVKLQGHPDGRGDNFMQKVHVGKYPLISCRYSKVTFEKGVKAIQERVQAEKQGPNYCSFPQNSVQKSVAFGKVWGSHLSRQG